ncbi:hypothetical protein C8J57DRAFT_1705420 [Mycena rebaudengoi]|nr:hypothetical protein C8J57DRAFT_1705420 [Mycena rebaudengoi]
MHHISPAFFPSHPNNRSIFVLLPMIAIPPHLFISVSSFPYIPFFPSLRQLRFRRGQRVRFRIFALSSMRSVSSLPFLLRCSTTLQCSPHTPRWIVAHKRTICPRPGPLRLRLPQRDSDEPIYLPDH